MKKINQKIIASILTTLLILTNLIPLGNQVIAANITSQNNKTNNSNVTFDSYLEGNVHSQTYNVEEEAKLYLNINVYNTGYLKNPVISISNTANYEIDTNNLKDENILSASSNQVTIKQIDSGKQVTIQLPIKIKTANKVESDFAEKTSEVTLNANYVDENGEEKAIEKTINNQVIWNEQKELNLDYKVTKYIPYNQGEEYGVLLQTVITSSIKGHVLPISKTQLEMNVPQIENVNPTSVNVISNKTTNTNNDENGNNFSKENYNYEEETGKLTITTNNLPDENNLIALNSNGIDEYVINCIYKGKDLYEKIIGKTYQSQMEVQVKVTPASEKQETIEGTIQVEYNEKEAKGNLVEVTPIVKNNITKGNIYANYDKKENKQQTTYEYSYIAQINELELNHQIQIQTKPDYYLDKNSNEFPVGNGSYIQQLKIEKSNFEKILSSENGTIEISKLDGTQIAKVQNIKELEEIQNQEASENKNIKIENGYIIINISEAKAQEIQIKTSKPVEVGNLEINILKAITENQEYSKNQMKDFNKIKLGLINLSNEGNKNKSQESETSETTISLAEPVSSAQISISEESQNLLTTAKNENVEMRVVLNTSNTKYALYKNPTLEIELPSQIEEINIKDVKLLLDDELKIANKQVITRNNKKVIQITLEGTQTNYLTQVEENTAKNVINKGANIIINADITLNKLSSSKQEQIKMYYTNKNTNLYETYADENKTKGIVSTNVNIIAPTGVSAINKITGYNTKESELISLNGEKQEVTIPAKNSKKTLTVEGIVTNNYENAIDNIYILGRIPFEGNKQIDGEENLNSTYTMQMARKLEISGIDKEKVKVYYSTNGEASKDLSNTSNEWKEEIEDIKTVKSYLIAINGDVAKSTQITFNYQVELPENLGPDESSYQMYKVYYNNKTEEATIGETKIAGTLGILTEKSPELEVTLSSNVEQNAEVTEGQIVKFFVKVKNVGKEEIKNVVLNIPVPNGTIYTKYNYSDQLYVNSEKELEQISLGNIAVNEEIKTNYELKMLQGNLGNVINKVNVTAQNLQKEIDSNEYALTKTEGKLELTLSVPREQNVALNKGNILYATLILEPKQELTNTQVTINIPNGIKINETSYTDKEGNSQNYVQVQNNTITANIPKLTANYMESMKFNLEIDTYLGGQDFNLVAEAVSNESKEQISNILNYHVGAPQFEITQTSSSERYLKEAKEITYEFIIKNVGDSDANDAIFEDALPQGLTFKKLEYTNKGKTTTTTSTLNNTAKARWTKFEKGASETVKVTAQADLLEESKQDKTVENVGTITAQGIEKQTSNNITTILEYNQELYKDSNNNNNGNNQITDQSAECKITGTAWLDENRNGQREETEKLLSGIEVMLFKRESSEIVKDISDGTEKTTRTSENGTYEFTNLSKGNYIIVFAYDTGKYGLTEYQKQNISQSYNSDAVSMLVILNGKQTYAGVTNTIKITNENIRDIDIGLYEENKFDLKLDKYISKITVNNPKSNTKIYNVNNSKLEKVETFKKNINQSNIVIEYKIIVTNEGGLAGYAKKIVDYLPTSTKFSSELNKDWYISESKNAVYNTSLENTLLKPGESKEITLVLSAQITNNNIGTIINNNAEIYESYNEYGQSDIDSVEANMLESEDDMSKADIILSTATGTIVIYSTLAIAILLILSIGILVIRRSSKEENIL